MHHSAPLVALAALLATGPARAAFQPTTGTVVLDEPGLSLDMEGPETFGELPLHFLNEAGHETQPELETRFEEGQAIEGERAFRFGGDLTFVLIELAPVVDTFAGRRVEISLWVRPEGTSIQGGASWALGSVWESMRSFAPDHGLGNMSLRFTGEITSDGWERWSTGPFDFTLGGAVPLDSLWLMDRQVMTAGTYVDRNAFAHVRLDALQIRDLGPAAVAPEACILATEAEVCGDRGACLFGRCVDAAPVVGAAILEPDLRDEFLRRKAFEYRTFDGSRISQARMDGFETTLEGLADEDRPRAFWTTLSRAVAALGDGHAVPPGEEVAEPFSTGICLGPGVADLIDGEHAPLVFRTAPEHPIGASLSAGDVLVAVDGEAVEAFRERAARHLYYAGDPGAYEAATTGALLSAAVLSGATLTFRRCPGLDAAGACAGALETIEIDLADAVAEVWGPGWRARPPEWPDVACDGRFKLPQGEPESVDPGWAVAYRRDGVQHLMFNGFPPSFYAPEWADMLFTPLRDAPARIVIDERLGYGGRVDVLGDLLGHFVETPSVPIVDLLPATDWPVDLDRVESLRACFATPSGEVPCGWFDEWRFGEGHPRQGVVAESRVAILISDDVSGNDYFTRLVVERPGETRIFGPGPTRGAYGPVLSLPNLLGEAHGGRFQIHDSLFVLNPVGPLPAWSTGTGVPPHEVVRQTQSDALRGVDTVLQAATTWVKQ